MISSAFNTYLLLILLLLVTALLGYVEGINLYTIDSSFQARNVLDYCLVTLAVLIILVLIKRSPKSTLSDKVIKYTSFLIVPCSVLLVTTILLDKFYPYEIRRPYEESLVVQIVSLFLLIIGVLGLIAWYIVMCCIIGRQLYLIFLKRNKTA